MPPPDATAFPLGLPVSGGLIERWGLSDLRALAVTAGRATALRALAERARPHLPEAPWRPGELMGLALLADCQRRLIAHYGEERIPGALHGALSWADEATGGAASGACLDAVAAAFPDAEALDGAGRAAELISLSVLQDNPAARPYGVLIDAPVLAEDAPCAEAVHALEAYFDDAPALAPGDLPLFAALRAPFLAHPGSLRAQLAFVRERWAVALPPWLLLELATVGDVLAEEETFRGAGPGPLTPLGFDGHHDEPERFSPDRDWMANVVLIAKSVHVWLDQLSGAYGEVIRRLDQIPEAELDRLARRGFTGLWLIGVWERSTASRTIKRWRGNPEALASAYAIHDYAIAEDLGGEEGWRALDARCRARGIRLASDMVPNHTAIDSRWVIERPELFLQLDHPPFPGYRFTGADLCPDPRVTVQIEDGYWHETDAAVVFKTYDHRDGRTRYIYHGNDGTSMPWNDTAQLDYLQAEVREAVVQQVLAVARRASIIRFDAAMTLAKRHIQRLWWPPPGHGGAIPSRAERSIPAEAFEAAMPEEFWREVVERVQAEVPDTLLLAEAFWLMEGYFVRSLGMHRVYNSAFMHMLRDEDNANYRQTLKNVLDFSDEVLKRFVNFMSNPDEETAVAQFGKGDKYFGVTTLLATLPGLPMFGHGQLEGLGEKYGMEYAKAYWDEAEDPDLVARHEREIVPLLRRRYLFSEARHFALYDLWTEDGHVNEDVFAYSNRDGDQRALIVYHNAYREAAGWVKQAVPVRRGGSEGPVERPTLLEALGVASDAGLLAMHEVRGGQWLLRSTRQLAEEGLYVTLRAYETQVYLDLHLVPDEGAWAELARRLGAAGVPDLDRAHRHVVYEAERACARAALGEPAQVDAEELATLTASPAAAVELAAWLAALPADDALARGMALLAGARPELVADADLADVVGEAAGVEGAAVALVAAGYATASTLLPAAETLLRVHVHEGTRWFRAEPMRGLLRSLAAFVTASALRPGAAEPAAGPLHTAEGIAGLADAVLASNHDWDLLLESSGVADGLPDEAGAEP